MSVIACDEKLLQDAVSIAGGSPARLELGEALAAVAGVAAAAGVTGQPLVIGRGRCLSLGACSIVAGGGRSNLSDA